MVQPLHDLTVRQCAAIGRVAVEWAHVEETLRLLFFLVGGLDDVRGRKIATELLPRTFYDVLLALAHDTEKPEGQQPPIYTVLRDTRQTVDELRGQRNYAVHTDWMSTADKKAIHAISYAAKGQLKKRYERLALSDLQRLAHQIAGLDQFLTQVFLDHRAGRLQSLPPKPRRGPRADSNKTRKSANRAP